MYEIEQTEEFEAWLSNLKDRRVAARIASEIGKMGRGLIADWKSLGRGIQELRLTYGPGYRLYFTFRNDILILLLCGGDKSTQRNDIKKAGELKEEYDG